MQRKIRKMKIFTLRLHTADLGYRGEKTRFSWVVSQTVKVSVSNYPSKVCPENYDQPSYPTAGFQSSVLVRFWFRSRFLLGKPTTHHFQTQAFYRKKQDYYYIDPKKIEILVGLRRTVFFYLFGSCCIPLVPSAFELPSGQVIVPVPDI
jgi:hypothetical protein